MPTPNYSFSNTAPVFVGQALGAGVGDAPAVVPGATEAFTADAPSALPGATVALTNVAPAALAATDTTGVIDTPRPRDFWPAIPTPIDPTMQTPALTFAGQLILDQVFGIYRAPEACVIKGIQLAAQVAPEGADVIIDLVDSEGVSLARSATLPADEPWSDTDFVTPLPILADGIVRAKVTQVGSSKPGSFLTVTLIVQILPAA